MARNFESSESQLPEQDSLQEQRILHDAELVEGGARVEKSVVRPTEEQLEELRSEMLRDRGEYSPEEKTEMHDLLGNILTKVDIPKSSNIFVGIRDDFRKYKAPEQRVGVDSEVLMKLERLREVNPKEFDADYKSQIDWDALKDAFEEEKKYALKENGYRVAAAASTIKDLFPEKAAEVVIDEKLWDKMTHNVNGQLHPSRFNLMGAAMEDYALEYAMPMAANMKSFDEERFNKSVVVSEEQIEKYYDIIENRKSGNRGYGYTAADKLRDPRTLRILEGDEKNPEDQ
jgi:hypothetical protein